MLDLIPVPFIFQLPIFTFDDVKEPLVILLALMLCAEKLDVVIIELLTFAEVIVFDAI